MFPPLSVLFYGLCLLFESQPPAEFGPIKRNLTGPPDTQTETPSCLFKSLSFKTQRMGQSPEAIFLGFIYLAVAMWTVWNEHFLPSFWGHNCAVRWRHHFGFIKKSSRLLIK